MVLLVAVSPTLFSQKQEIVWSDQEKPIVEQLQHPQSAGRCSRPRN